MLPLFLQAAFIIFINVCFIASGAWPDIPSDVFWAVGIAVAAGFLLGRFPPEGANRDVDFGIVFETIGAVIWAVAAGAAVAGGLIFAITSGYWSFAFVAISIGALVAAFRMWLCYPRNTHRVFMNGGIHRAKGDTVKARLEEARRLYYSASFLSSYDLDIAVIASRLYNWEFEFGKSGPSASAMAMLRTSIAMAGCSTFDILVVLLRSLPDEPQQPAVLIVRGLPSVQALQVDDAGLKLPDYDKKIPASSIIAFVGYAWR